MKYCSKECQREAWKHPILPHKAICTSIRPIHDAVVVFRQETDDKPGGPGPRAFQALKDAFTRGRTEDEIIDLYIELMCHSMFQNGGEEINLPSPAAGPNSRASSLAENVAIFRWILPRALREGGMG